MGLLFCFFPVISNNHTTAFTYDEANRLALTRDPLDNETRYSF